MSALTIERLSRNLELVCDADSRAMIWGPPGVGKSMSIYHLGLRMRRRVVVVIGSYVDPTTMGFPVLDPDNRYTGVDGKRHPVVDMAPQRLFVELNTGDPWLLFLDELTCVPASVQSTWLRLIADGYAGEYRLDLTRGSIIAAGNPADQAVNGTPLEMPMVNRMDHFKYPVNESAALEWANGSFVNYWGAQDLGWPKNMRKRGVNDDHIIRARSMISEFVRRKPTVWHPAIEGSSFVYGSGEEGWPSARSLDRASRHLTIALAEGREPVTCLDLIEGAIGSSAAIEFQQYVSTADIPDPEAVIAAADKWKFSGRVDLDYATMLSVAAAITARPTADRILAGFTVCERSVSDRNGAPAKEAAMAAINSLGGLVVTGSKVLDAITRPMSSSERDAYFKKLRDVAAPFIRLNNMIRGEA